MWDIGTGIPPPWVAQARVCIRADKVAAVMPANDDVLYLYYLKSGPTFAEIGARLWTYLENVDGVLHHAQARNSALQKHIPDISERYYLIREEIQGRRLLEIAVRAPDP